MERVSKIVAGLIVGLFVFTMAAVPVAQADETRALRISGDGLFSNVVNPMIKKLSKESPEFKAVVMGATTEKGFGYFTDGQADVIMASRMMTDEEFTAATKKDISPAFKFMGNVPVAIITKADNPVNELTMDQLSEIFSGRITNWSDVGGRDEPIVVTARPVPQTGLGVLFQETVLRGAPYSDNVRMMPLYRTTVRICGKSDGNGSAIGYIPTSSSFFADWKSKGIKVLAVKMGYESEAVTPAQGISADDSYPINIPFYLYWDRDSSDMKVRSFTGLAGKSSRSMKVATGPKTVQ